MDIQQQTAWFVNGCLAILKIKSIDLFYSVKTQHIQSSAF
jgi:hypothetical protein